MRQLSAGLENALRAYVKACLEADRAIRVVEGAIQARDTARLTKQDVWREVRIAWEKDNIPAGYYYIQGYLIEVGVGDYPMLDAIQGGDGKVT